MAIAQLKESLMESMKVMIIEDEIDIPGINYKNKLAFRLYYLDKNFAIKSIIIPLSFFSSIITLDGLISR